MKQFEDLEEKPIKIKGKSIVTELLGALGSETVGTFSLSWTEYAGLRRHITQSGKRKVKPLLRAKLLDYKGTGRARAYSVAIAKGE